jgi:hypothetical protein
MILNYKHRFDDIKDMSIADGLKAVLIEYGLTSEIIHEAAKEQLHQSYLK